MHRYLGQLQVSAIGLGCLTLTAAYGTPPIEADAIGIIHRAAELGIDFLDTSDAYANGANEVLVGKAIAGRRGDYVVASKFGNLRKPDGTPTADGRPDYVRQACEASLRRLKIETIDLYYIHRVDPTVPIEDTVGAMADLVRAGKVRALGISEAAPATIRRSCGASDERGADRIFVVDPPCRGLGAGRLPRARHRVRRL
jgi:aryl-alcohol dehydrogenase-like predicted oxidoreductase